MSGIFGIFNRNGKHVEKKTVDAMMDAMSYWDPDEQGVWMDGPVALGHAMLWNTPESKYEHFPVKRDAYVLTMDARIDNREELAKEIELPALPLSEIGDSEFILGAYKKWGEECPKHLLGDFAFAIWDAKKEQMFCARDHMGVKQFYYHLSDDLFLFGNDLKVLTKYPEIKKELNPEAIANYLVHEELIDPKITFLKSAVKLPPAHVLLVDKNHIKEKCFWKLEDAPKMYLPNIEAYIHKLRELLEQAVESRLRTAYPMTSHLSGGLDSSSIAVMAARKLKKKNETLLAFNWLQEPSEDDDPSHYEWAYSREIAEREGIKHHYVTLTEEEAYESTMNKDVLYGDTTGGIYETLIQKQVHQHGSRTILSGWGGDDCPTYRGQSYYADLFRSYDWVRLLKELKILASEKNWHTKSILGFAYYKIFLPQLPLWARTYLINSNNIESEYYKFVDEDIKLRTKQLTIKINENNPFRFPSATVRGHILELLNFGHIQNRFESWNCSSMKHKLEHRYPLLDKRILEFIMGVPAKYHIFKGKKRYLYRQAVADLLPTDILWSDSKNEPKRVEYLTYLYKTVLIKFEKNTYEEEGLPYIHFGKIKQEIQKLRLHENKIDENTEDQIYMLITYLELYTLLYSLKS